MPVIPVMPIAWALSDITIHSMPSEFIKAVDDHWEELIELNEPNELTESNILEDYSV